MKLKDLLDTKDSITCPILIFAIETDENIYETDFVAVEDNFEAYYEYISNHAYDNIHNISITRIGKLTGLSICLNKR